jgi:hypothetical protein
VPVISAEDGQWLATGPLQLMMKPGGHGAIWKLMADQQVFEWLAAQQRQAGIVRQISNPIAGVQLATSCLRPHWMGAQTMSRLACTPNE